MGVHCLLGLALQMQLVPDAGKVIPESQNMFRLGLLGWQAKPTAISRTSNLHVFSNRNNNMCLTANGVALRLFPKRVSCSLLKVRIVKSC